MGRHPFARKLHYELSLEQLVPQNNLLRRIAAVIDDATILARLLDLNLQRSAAKAP